MTCLENGRCVPSRIRGQRGRILPTDSANKEVNDAEAFLLQNLQKNPRKQMSGEHEENVYADESTLEEVRKSVK